MLDLLLEGLESAWLPCSLILLVPGAAAIAASGGRLLYTGAGFSVASLILAWLRFSVRGGDWPVGIAAVALIGATVVLVGPIVRDERYAAIAGGVLAGGASAELWEPCVGAEFGQLLNELPDRGGTGLALLAAYVIGVLSPLAGFGAVVWLIPDRMAGTARLALAIGGAVVLTVLAVATALGFGDDIVGRLVLWSL